MKTAFVLLLSLCTCIGVNSQVIVNLKTGNWVNTSPEKNPNNNPNDFADCIFDGKYFLWLQFNDLPTEAKKQELLSTGVELYDYLPRNTFVASFPISYNFSLLNNYNVYAVSKPSAAHKIDGQLFNPSQISWAITTNGNLKINVSYLPTVSPIHFAASLINMGFVFNFIGTESTDIIVVEASIENIKKIATHPLVQFIEPCTHPGVLEDIQGITDHRTTFVQTSDNWITGKKLDGSGVNIANGDDGFIGPHIDFQGRLTNNATDMTAANTHGDHTSGIIAGAGNFNPQVRGQAPGANLISYDYYAPYSLFPSIYSNNLIRIVSHSLGQTCNSGYDANARTSDLLIKTYPYLMYVHSAGNSGNTNCGGLTNWRNITGGFKAGKNVIAVANLTKADVADASSSRGPLPDGRIKPDISAVGNSVNSTQPNNTFAVFSGTSMACPAVAGNLAVLYQAFKNKSNGVNPEGSLIKAIALNTADDLGNPGPDFIYGWGRINVRKAVLSIENTKYFSDVITNGVTNTHSIAIPPNVATAKIMVYWGDKEASANAAKSLVNNLDAKILDQNLNEYLPWVLDIGTTPDETSIAAPAINGIDSVNNVEQIQLDNPTAGNYSLKVLGKSIPFGPQKYFVVMEYTLKDEIVVTFPNGGESFAPSESQRIRWDASNSATAFKIEYSINDGSTWNVISSTVPGSRRYFDWTIPSTATSKSAKIRISQGTTASDVSDTSFIVLKVPTGITFSNICAGTIKVSWSAVTGATSYDVCRLGSKYMDVVATTTALNVILNDVGDSLNWFAVRAKMGAAQANGRRSNAVSYTNTSVVVCPVPVKLVSFIATTKNSNVLLEWVVANEEGMLQYIVEKSTSPTFDKVETVGVLIPTNKPFNQTYQLLDKNTAASKVWYYRLKMVDAAKALYSSTQVIKLDNTSNHITLSPNPAKNVINITTNENISNAVVKIYNELGVEVLTKRINNLSTGNKLSIAIDNMPSGNYFLSLVNILDGSIVFKQQISIIK